MKTTNKKLNIDFWGKDIIIAGIASYLAAICTLQSLGFITKLPIAFAVSFVASVFCKSRKWLYLFMAVMPALINSLYVYGMKVAITASFICLVASFFGVLAKRSVYTINYAKAKGNKNIIKKCIVVLAVSVIIGVGIQYFDAGFISKVF